MDLSSAELGRYQADGFLGPFPLLTTHEIQVVIREYADTWRRLPWYKGLHVWDTACLQAILRPEVIGRVTSILGENVLLWSETLMVKRGGEPHRWHSDVETQEFQSVNVWAGLQNVGAASPMMVIPGSHRYGTAPQDLDIDPFSADSVRSAARSFNSAAEIQELFVEPGEFVMFEGSIWHGTQNRGSRTRRALLAQYCQPEATVRIPKSYSSPVQWSDQVPPCILVSGNAPDTANLLTEPKPLARKFSRRLAYSLHEAGASMRTRLGS